MIDNFKFLGDFRFAGKDAWLEFRIPMSALRSLIGSSTKHLRVERQEIAELLRAIERNPRTPESKRQIARDLLAKT